MHTERYRVPPETMAACRRAAAGGGGRDHDRPGPGDGGRDRRAWRGTADLFIRPGFRFAVVDVLMTNFHLPRSQPAGAAGGLLRAPLALAVRRGPRGRGTASCPSGTPCSWREGRDRWAKRAARDTARPDQSSTSTARPAPAWSQHAERDVHDPVLHARRHPRRRAAPRRRGPRRPRARRSSWPTPTTSCCGPGRTVVAALGGLHRFTGWDGHLLTDSGGFQVFSLDPRVDDDGVTFRSTYDGSLAPPDPRSGRWPSRSAWAPTSRWSSTSAPALPAPDDGDPPGRRAGPWPGRPGRARAHRRADQACSASSRAGSPLDLRAEYARADRGPRLRRVRHRRAVGGRAARADAARPGRRRGRAPRRPAPLPDGGRGPGHARSRPSRSGSTCSTASCRPGWPATAPP